MVKTLFAVLLGMAVLSGPVMAKTPADGFRLITPTTFDHKAELRLSGKTFDYYVLEPGSTVEVQVKGPSRLKMISRAIFSSASDSLSYAYAAAREGTKKPLVVRHTTRPADKASLTAEPAAAVGLSRVHVIDVPRGKQTYTFSLPKNATTRVLLRFSRETHAFSKRTAVVPMTPAEFTAAVDLVSGEATSTYYRIGTGHQVGLRLIGPATLKVLSRIEYDPNMNGRQKWKVRVTEDGKVKGTYALTSRKSEVTAYQAAAALVASRAETFYVEVPAGEHRYEFTLPDNHRTVLLRFLLPKTELAKE